MLQHEKLNFKKIKIFYRTNINSSGLEGSVTLIRQTIFEPTWISFDIGAQMQDAGYLTATIHDLPPKLELLLEKSYCQIDSVGVMYDPLQLQQTEGYSAEGTFVLIFTNIFKRQFYYRANT